MSQTQQIGVLGGDWGTDSVHLLVNGKERVVELPVPRGPRTLMDLFTPARELSETLTRWSIEGAREKGRSISCRAGCGACCRQLVGISVIEARHVADVVAAMPEPKRTITVDRFALAVKRLEEAGLLDAGAKRGERLLSGTADGDVDAARITSRRYFELKIACPMLENESCGIYPERPMMCREYHVSSPAELCAHVHEGGVKKIVPLLHMGSSLARTAARVAKLPTGSLPLVMSLEWSAAHGHRLDEIHDGDKLFGTWLEALDGQWDMPFEQRG